VTEEHVARVYGPHVRVLAHPETGEPLVVPALR
jgi:ABC-type hemin transport system ATPase subunit